MSFLEEHELTFGPLCGECHAFHVDPENGSQPCYHCFASKGQLDPCRICAGKGKELLAELDSDSNLEEEATRVRLVLSNRNKQIN